MRKSKNLLLKKIKNKKLSKVSSRVITGVEPPPSTACAYVTGEEDPVDGSCDVSGE